MNKARFRKFKKNSVRFLFFSFLVFVLPQMIFADWHWDIVTVDSGRVGTWCSIALDSSGNPHISYCDYGNGNLKYAKWDGSSWDIKTADSGGNVGDCTSIALDSSGNPHISYYDYSNRALKYAKWDGSSWDIVTVDSSGWVGQYASIALDSSDNPHISYWDYSNTALKYAKWDGSSWGIEPVDSSDWVGEYTSIVLDSSDNPHISYFDNTNGTLKYAKWTLTYYIKGEVKDSKGTGIANVTMNLTGDVTKSTTTQSDGSYEFLDLPGNGDYTITPEKTNYTFSPVSISTTSLSGDLDNQDFVGTFNTYYIKGEVKDSKGTGIANVTMNLTGDVTKSTTTKSDGSYQFLDLPGNGNYTITPEKTNYTFSPVSISTTSLSGDLDNQNFVGTSHLSLETEIRGGEKGYIQPLKNEQLKIILRPKDSGTVEIKIYNLNGQLIWEKTEEVSAGTQDVVSWACRNAFDEIVASGIYIVHIKGCGIDIKKKVAVLK